jgi:hypothetical protein
MELDYSLLHKINCIKDSEIFTKDRLQALQPILENINTQTSILEVTHSPRFDLGRFYPDRNISPIVLSRHIKHTLFTYLDWIDIDMVKGHATILYEISKHNNITLASFKKYIDDFPGIVTMLQEYYGNISSDNIKNLFNVMIYGGGFNGWIQHLENNGSLFVTTNIHPFIASFKRECDNIISVVYLNNSAITQKIKGDETCEFKLKNKTMSYFCQTIENEIIHIVYKVLVKRKIIKSKEFALEYDGICFKKPDGIDLEDALEDVNATILSKTGFNVLMKWKGYSNEYIHHDIIDDMTKLEINEKQYIESFIITPETLDECETYAQFKNIFERSHFKCRSTAAYYKEDRLSKKDNSIELVYYTEHGIRTAYRDYNYEPQIGKKKIKYYIDEWFDDRNKRVYESMMCFPPPLICPSNVYNTWSPFSIVSCTALEKDTFGRCIIPEDISDELEHKYDFVCNHINAMCGYDPIAYNYLLYWFGNLFLYPADNASMPSIIGDPGTGKSQILKYASKIIPRFFLKNQ